MSSPKVAQNTDLSDFPFQCVTTGIHTKFRSVLAKFGAEFHSTDVSPKFSIKQEDGSLRKGDYSIHLPEFFSKEENVKRIIDHIQLEFSGTVENCHAGEFSRVIVKLNRSSTYLSVLPQVFLRKENYGVVDVIKNVTTLIIPHFSGVSGLNDLRTQLIAQHVGLILSANGYKTYLSKRCLSSTTSKQNLKLYNCTEECDLNDVLEDIGQLADKSQWKANVIKDKPGVIDTNLAKVERLVLDGRKYLDESDTSSEHYYKTIGNIYLKKGDITDCMKKSALIRHISDHHINDNLNMTVHIVPENQIFNIVQSGLVLQILNESCPEQYYVMHQRILCNINDVDVNEYFERKREEIQKSLVHKYGSGIMTDKTWQTCVENITNTVITFDFLLTGRFVPLKLDLNIANCGSGEKGGAFVQYNCARLSTLFKHFEDRVRSGFYDPLPNFEDIDFSQLKLQEEWNLFFNYVLPFPSLVQELVAGLSSIDHTEPNIPTHKIPQMLIKLSRDLSMYYNKTRILVDSSPQLQKRMYARLYLLQSIHQVMKCSLALLNLPAVDKM